MARSSSRSWRAAKRAGRHPDAPPISRSTASSRARRRAARGSATSGRPRRCPVPAATPSSSSLALLERWLPTERALAEQRALPRADRVVEGRVPRSSGLLRRSRSREGAARRAERRRTRRGARGALSPGARAAGQRPTRCRSQQPPAAAKQPDNRGTSHLCVVDAEGNIAAVTTTVNLRSAPASAVGGFWLNDEMDDFAREVGKKNAFGLVGGAPNLPGPGQASRLVHGAHHRVPGRRAGAVHRRQRRQSHPHRGRAGRAVRAQGRPAPGAGRGGPRVHSQAEPEQVDARDLPPAHAGRARPRADTRRDARSGPRTYRRSASWPAAERRLAGGERSRQGWRAARRVSWRCIAADAPGVAASPCAFCSSWTRRAVDQDRLGHVVRADARSAGAGPPRRSLPARATCSWSGGVLHAQVRRANMQRDPVEPIALAQGEDVNLESVDAVFVRTDPPFDSQYLWTTLMLERLRGKTLVVNDPRGLRDANEKLYACQFPELMPETLVTSHRERIKGFVQQVGGRAVIKPIDGAGRRGRDGAARGRPEPARDHRRGDAQGRATWRWCSASCPSTSRATSASCCSTGEPIGALLRVPTLRRHREQPAHGRHRRRPAQIDDADRKHHRAHRAAGCAQDGLYFVGIDVIGGLLTEVNVTSPTGIQQIARFNNENVSARRDRVGRQEGRCRLTGRPALSSGFAYVPAARVAQIASG